GGMDRMILRNNHIHHAGIGERPPNDFLGAGDHPYNIYTNGGYNPDGTGVGGTVIIEGNELDHANSWSVHFNTNLGVQTGHLIIRNNVLHDDGLGGRDGFPDEGKDLSEDVVNNSRADTDTFEVYNNIFYNTVAGAIGISPLRDGNSIYNNTIYNSGNG